MLRKAGMSSRHCCRTPFLLCITAALTSWAGVVYGSEGGDGHPEYLAVYSLGVGGSHTLQLGGAPLEERSVEFMVVPSSSADQEGLEEAERASASAWEDLFSGSEAPTSLLNGSSAIPSRSVVYTVPLLTSESSSTFTEAANRPIVEVALAIPVAGAYTLLLNHGEVPAAMMSPTGEVLVPVVFEEGGHAEEQQDQGAGSTTARQWANALAESFLISLCSFAGIVTVVSSRVAHKINLSLAFLFASGALLATTSSHHPGGDGRAQARGRGRPARRIPAFGCQYHRGYLRSLPPTPRARQQRQPLPPPLVDGAGATAIANKIEAIAVRPRNDGHGEGEEEVSSGILAGNDSPVVAPAPGVGWGGYKASSLNVDGDGCGDGSDRIVAGEATAFGGIEGTITEDCSDDSRGCEEEEGRRQRRRRPNGDASEVAAEEGKSATAFARSYRMEPGQAPVFAAPSAVNLRDAKRVGADRGLFDVTGLDPICWNVVCGDIAHNFSDGVTMAAAFLGCSLTVGWTVMAANMMHEIPHEVGNFMALVNGGMSVKQALLYNFLSALFNVLGVVLTFSLREVITAAAISYLLLIGSGTFIFVGLSELVPDALSSGGSSAAISGTDATTAAFAADGSPFTASHNCSVVGRERVGTSVDAGVHQLGAATGEKQKEAKHLHRRGQVRKALAFAVGAVLLGLPLLTHTHCDADGGHDHR
ncbi:unnamed protein product [Pylaiella littoralis]